MQVLRRFLLVGLGFWGGVVASAAVLKRILPSSGDAESDQLNLVAIFDGVQLANRSTSFRGGSLLSWFGGIDLDLRQAHLAPGAHLRVHALWGGIAIQIPPEWRVESRTRAIAGGVAVDPARIEAPEAPVLLVDGLALLGGIAVGRKNAS